MKKDNNNSKATNWFLLALLFVFVSWGVNWYLLAGNKTDRGTFGDMFGAVNSLFSGLAVAGLVYAIIVQRHELKIAKEDLRNTKVILSKQLEQLDLQNQATTKQNFENTFFQLLTMFTRLTENIDLIDPETEITTKGKDVFVVFSIRIQKAFGNVIIGKVTLGEYITPYEKFYGKHKTELGNL